MGDDIAAMAAALARKKASKKKKQQHVEKIEATTTTTTGDNDNNDSPSVSLGQQNVNKLPQSPPPPPPPPTPPVGAMDIATLAAAAARKRRDDDNNSGERRRQRDNDVEDIANDNSNNKIDGGVSPSPTSEIHRHNNSNSNSNDDGGGETAKITAREALLNAITANRRQNNTLHHDDDNDDAVTNTTTIISEDESPIISGNGTRDDDNNNDNLNGNLSPLPIRQQQQQQQQQGVSSRDEGLPSPVIQAASENNNGGGGDGSIIKEENSNNNSNNVAHDNNNHDEQHNEKGGKEEGNIDTSNKSILSECGHWEEMNMSLESFDNSSSSATTPNRRSSSSTTAENENGGGGGPPMMSIAAMAAAAAQKKSLTPKAADNEGGAPMSIAAMAAAAAQKKSLTPKAADNEGGGPPMSIAAMAAAAAQKKSSTPKATDNKGEAPMSIAAMAAAAAQKKSITPKSAEDEGEAPMSIAAMAAAAAQKKSLTPKAADNEGGGPPMSIAAMAAAAAQKKSLTPKATDNEGGAPMSIAAMAAAAAQKKSLTPKAADNEGGAPMSIAAMAAAAAQKKSTTPKAADNEGGAPMSIAAMAAAAAQKKSLTPKVASDESNSSPPISIAAMAAAAAQKKSLTPKATDNEGGPPMSIAAMAAAAAQKKSSSSSKAASDETNDPPPMSIAAMAAAAAQKKSSTPKVADDEGGAPMSIAAMAAAAAQKKSLSPKAAADNEGEGPPPMSIAAMAAAAAQKKSLSPKAAADNEGEGPPSMSIAAMAAAAAQKKAASPKSAESNSDVPPMNIAAMAAAAAQKKSSTPKVASDESNSSPPMSIAAMAAAAAQKKSTTPNKSPNAPMSISEMAARAAQKKAQSPQPPVSPPNIGTSASAASRNRQRQQQQERHHHHHARAQHFSLPQRKHQQRKPKNIIIQQHRRRRNIQSLPRAYDSPKDMRALELHKRQGEAAKLEAQQKNLQLLESRGQMRQMHSSLSRNYSSVEVSFERLEERETSASAFSAVHPKGRTMIEDVSSTYTVSNSFDLTTRTASLSKNTIFSQLRDDTMIDVSNNDDFEGSGWNDVDKQDGSSGRPKRKRSYFHTTEQQRHSQTDATSTELSSLRSSAMPSRSNDKLRERRKKQIYDDVDDSFNFSEDSPSDDVHDKAAEALLRVIKMKNLDFDSVLDRLESLGRRQSRRSSSIHSRDKENRRQERQVKTADPLSTPDNDAKHYGEDYDDESIGDLSTESADHRRLAKNAHKLANHIMQTPQQEFASKKVPLKEDPEFNLYFRMLRYGFTMGAVRAALSRDGKPDITRLDPDRPLCVQKVPRALDQFHRQDSVEVAGLEIGHDGITDEGWENALSSAREASDFSSISSPAASIRDRTPSHGVSGRKSPATPPPWLRQNQADRGIVQGWLRKKTRRGRWVRRWYYLDATGMYYSHAPPTSRNTSSKLGKYTKLADTRALRAKRSPTNPLEFELWQQSNSAALVTLRAHSLVELNEWVDAVSNAIERQRLVDEVVVGHVVPVDELRDKVGVLGGGLFGDGSGAGVGVDQSPKSRADASSGNGLSTSGDGYGGNGGVDSGSGGGYGDGNGLGGYGDGTGGGGGLGSGGGGQGTSVNLQSVIDSESLNVGEDGRALISADALDEVKRLFTLGTGPLAPHLSTPQPKRSKLKRQNSWPPISLMSNGDLVLGDELAHKQIDDDLKKKPEEEKKLDEKKAEESKDSDLDTDGEPKLKNDPKYGEYFSMLKNGTPKESVQETMKSRGLDQGILDLDPEKSLKSQQAVKKEESEGDGEPLLKDDKRYAKYFKMMKMGLPKEAAKHAMKRDGIEDDSILDLDPEKSLKSQQAVKKEESEGDGEPLLKDDKRYAKYFKMMKMGLPKEAAKHAMKRDGIEDDSILDLDPEKSLKSQRSPKEEDTGPPLKDDPKYSKYFKMIKMGLPKEAAKHAMKRDGIEDDSILDLDPEKSLKSQRAAKEEDTGPPLKDDPKYSKYFKMIKMGLPKEAAKHAMVRDQLDPSILDLDPEKSLKSQLGGDEEKDTGPPLKDDPKFAKYFKMLKMGLPMGAVKNALTRDGLDPGIMDLDHDKSVSSQLDAKKKSVLKEFKMNKKPKIRRKKVYWTQVDATDGTVWQVVKSSKLVLDIDIDEFEKLFTQAVDADKEKEKKEKEAAKSSKKSGTVKVIDSKRGMNGDIILRKVKLSPTEVATLVENMDVGSLDAVELKSLYEFMPTDEEIKALTAYLESSKDKTEEISYMTPCEQYMVAMKDLKDSDKKFQCIIFLSEFGHKLKELKWDVDHLSAACEQLKTSKRFRTLLKMILLLVNRINTGDDGGAIADGFTLDTLAKLNETKAFDNKTTVLHYLVKLIRKTNVDVLKFTEDIKDVVLAKGVVMDRLLSSVKQLIEDAQVAEDTAIKDGDLYRQSLKDPSQMWKFSNKVTNVKAQRGSVKEIRQMATFLGEEDVPVCKMDSTHFERFAAFAKLELQEALSLVEEVEKQYAGLLEFFGEDATTQVGDFFGLIDQFMLAFDQTLDQVEKEEEEKLKEARRALAKEAKLKVKSAFKNAADATKMAKEKSSEDGTFPKVERSQKFLRKVSKDDRPENDSDETISDADSGVKVSSDTDPRQALFAALKSRRVEKEENEDEEDASLSLFSISPQKREVEKAETESKRLKAEGAKLAEKMRKMRMKKLEEEAAKDRLRAEAEFEKQQQIEHERKEKELEMNEARIAQGHMERATKKAEQEAAVRAKIEAEEARKRREAELRARIDAIERAHKEEQEEIERARRAEEERKREKMEMRKREQEELRAKIEAEAMARKELEERRRSIKNRHKAKEEEKARLEREAREQKKKELRAKIMAEEKAQKELKERKRREDELRARIMNETRKLQEDNIEDDLRAWLSKKEKLKSSGNVVVSSSKSLSAKPATSNQSSISRLSTTADVAASRPKPSRQPSRLSMAVAQAAAAKQRRESVVAVSTTTLAEPRLERASQDSSKAAVKTTVKTVKSDDEEKEDKELMAWLKKRKKKNLIGNF